MQCTLCESWDTSQSAAGLRREVALTDTGDTPVKVRFPVLIVCAKSHQSSKDEKCPLEVDACGLVHLVWQFRASGELQGCQVEDGDLPQLQSSSLKEMNGYKIALVMNSVSGSPSTMNESPDCPLTLPQVWPCLATSISASHFHLPVESSMV